MAEVVAPFRDYVLNAEERGEYTAATISTDGYLVLDGIDGVLLLESGDKLLLESTQEVQSPELIAPHRDYVVVADKPEYA